MVIILCFIVPVLPITTYMGFLISICVYICYVISFVIYKFLENKRKDKQEDDDFSNVNNEDIELKPSELGFVNKFTGVKHVVNVSYDFGSKSYKIVDLRNKQIWSDSFESEESAYAHIVDICNSFIENSIVHVCED
ncbi:MAG: hypothetical protein NC548_27435 [Lachnospiraceae bacterium]|nr:hypothetical protein [Lachnospiraceae bacterium]